RSPTMLLAADQFDQVIASMSVRQDAVGAGLRTSGGQRRAPRIPVLSRLTVVPFAPGSEGLAGYEFPRDAAGKLRMPLGEPQSVPVRDLSRGGVRFLMPRRLPLETPFVLVLPRPAGESAPLAVEATVTYWQPIARDLFAIGAQFHRLLDGFAAPAATPTVVLPQLDDAATVAALRPAV
ncbi:MAG TPA: PilZ domain-containing protein, partial [Humisphaera sp.]